MNRRRFLALAGGAGLAISGLACTRWTDDTWNLQVNQVEVPLPHLPQWAENLKIAHLSDLHVGQDVPDDFIRQALKLAQQEKPDLIILTGDFVSYNWENLRRMRSAFRVLKAKFGVFACLGNHDSFCDREKHVCAELKHAGVQVLDNDAVQIGQSFWLAGLGDPTTQRDDLQQALRNVPADACCLLMSHAPDAIDQAAQAGVDLVLAGHTHGGQVCLPVIGPPLVPAKHGPKYAQGLFSHKQTRMFVTRGIGVVTPAYRLNCPPEVAILTLKRADQRLPDGQFGIDFRPVVRKLRILRWG